MSVHLIGDPGSTHLGSLDRAKELIRVGAEAGLDAVKFQLFPNEGKYINSGNVYMPYEWIGELVDYGLKENVAVFASVFDFEAANHVFNAGLRTVKIAYSMRNTPLFDYVYNKFGYGTYVSSGYLDNLYVNARNLYCIPEYPVLYEVSFDRIFDRFEGFSDHTLGIRQTIRAIQKGATVIEKHFKLGDGKDELVPDGRFAITPDEVRTITSGWGKVMNGEIGG